MSAPRIFVSSTYYDLKHVRNDLHAFIEGLGYTAVMHEKSDIPYTQQSTLEHDCYDEVSNCDILVCIIGSSFGSASNDDKLSVTMKELEQALKDRKKVYVFIDKEVYCENKIYRKNRTKDFEPAIANTVKIHEYICQLEERVKKQRPILLFENSSDIVDQLRMQFAGLLQRYLQRESSAANNQMAYELHEEIDSLKSVISEVVSDHEQFCDKLSSTVLVRNPTVDAIAKELGLAACGLLIPSFAALKELMHVCMYQGPTECTRPNGDSGGETLSYYSFSMSDMSSCRSVLVVKDLFDEDGKTRLLPKSMRDKAVIVECDDVDNGMPF